MLTAPTTQAVRFQLLRTPWARGSTLDLTMVNNHTLIDLNLTLGHGVAAENAPNAPARFNPSSLPIEFLTGG